VNPNRLVPAMALFAGAVTSASAFDLQESVPGTLHIGGYVDAIFQYGEYGANAPRTGSLDNQNIWNTRYRERDIPFRLTIGSGGVSLTPLSSGLGLSADPTWSYLGNASTRSGLAPILPLNLPNESMTIGGAGGLTITTDFHEIEGGEQRVADFSAAAELQVSWDITEDVRAYFDIEWTDADTTALENAYVHWTFAPGWHVMMGEYLDWLNWEGQDAPDLYRINQSNIKTFAGVYNTVGGNVGWGNENVQVALHVVDTIWGDPLGVKDGDDLAGGLVFTAGDSVTDDFSWKIRTSVNVDRNATVGQDALDEVFDFQVLFPALLGVASPATAQQHLFFADSYREDLYGFNVWGQIQAGGLLTALDFIYLDYDVAEAMGVMWMANYALPSEVAPFPMSWTFMASYIDPNTEDREVEQIVALPGGGAVTITDYVRMNGQDAEELELALAYLTNPAGSDKFGVNFELRYIMRDDIDHPLTSIDATIDDRDEISLFVEFLAVIP